LYSNRLSYRVTVWTRSALLVGRCVSYFLSEPIILLNWGTYQTLNYISLASLICTCVLALALPNVKWTEVVERHLESGRARKEAPTSYFEFVKHRFSDFSRDAREVFSDEKVVRWSICWALFMCGYLQVRVIHILDENECYC
jgi:thiamine transporter 2/3